MGPAYQGRKKALRTTKKSKREEAAKKRSYPRPGVLESSGDKNSFVSGGLDIFIKSSTCPQQKGQLGQRIYLLVVVHFLHPITE